MNREQSKQKIESLVQTFHTEKRETINEAETRLRFIDPFFEALGWDIRNPREVRVESTLARSASTRPDYRFLIDSKTKFFVEAKKPAVKLTDLAPIFQAKSYGFSSKVPLVILTDFEEFRPFRTLARPKFDKPLDGLVKEFDYTYERYIDEFDNLYDTFSREVVAAGELEKRIPAEKKEASQTVDKEFLNDLSKWQEELAKNIALRNAKLTVSEINEAVQRILDRIIFLRICEDRQIEESEILLSYADKENIYPKLQKEFVRLRSKYNGLIFNEHKLSERLAIDDRLLKDIIKNLYLPHSPYRFNEIPIEILGTIYEQYLGKVITLTPTHRAKVDVKPEVRKAGGVFYTPHFITSYIVKNTVGKLLTPSVSPPYEVGDIPPQAGRGGRTPEQIAKMRFADIACGSGSFLLEMFDYLIRYHIDYYSANPSTIKTIDGVPDAFQTSQGLWHLSTRKKKEILLNNIYGVDIDPQAVEVTQMSLYLKLLEGESAETFDKQMTLELRETILPSLSNNIKCGNSLVGMDIKGLGNTLSLEEELRIRPFDWETAFPEVMRNGGFDAIVGNPPYVRQEMLGKLKNYLQTRYKVYHGTADLYVYFFERAHQLLRPGGFFGMICSNKFIRSNYGKGLRDFLKTRAKLIEIVDFGELPVFEGPATFPAIFLTQNEQAKEQRFVYASIKRLTFSSLQSEVTSIGKVLSSRSLEGDNWTLASEEEVAVFEKMRLSSVPLESYVDGKVYFGIKTGLNEAFVIDEQTRKRLIKEDPKCKSLIVPFVVGDDVRKYHINFENRYLILLPTGWTKKHSQNSRNPWDWFEKNCPSIAKHLKPQVDRFLGINFEKRAAEGTLSC